MILICLESISCTQIKREDLPNFDIAKKYGIDSASLAYQYYQKYGLTDVCEDIKMIARMEVAPRLHKKLPFSSNDLEKLDIKRINGSEYKFLLDERDLFQDIELDFIEYTPDTTLRLNLEKGYYEIRANDLNHVIKIYDAKSGLFYIEVHKCP